MKVSLNSNVSNSALRITFDGTKGREFINRNITKQKYIDKTDTLVGKIKTEFKLNTENSTDILEALVDEIKILKRALFMAEDEITKLSKTNSKLKYINSVNLINLENKDKEIRSLRYRNHMLRR
jgi:hypothetical protein